MAWRYVYDPENRLQEVWRGSERVAFFRYDAEGNRLVREVGEVRTVVVDEGYEVRGGVVRKVYRLGHEVVAVREGSAVYAVVGDHLGSLTVLAQGGSPAGVTRYLPYGAIRLESGAFPTDRRFTGQRWEGIGLYDYGARYYSPDLGRWISADVLVPNPTNPQSLNRYAYVSNSPVVHLDPDGRFAIVPVLIVAGVVMLKAVDYGWTAYDLYQSGQTLTDPNAGRGEKLLAGLNIALAVALEAGEPDDEIPVSLPLDDLGRRAVLAGARQALAEGGEEALERYLRERLGAQADEVLGWMMREAGEEAAQNATGQWHHVFSEKIMRQLERHPTLRGLFGRDDLVVQALDEASHQGYQTWHRAYDYEVVDWLARNREATREQFLRFLRDIYARPEMRQRFPDALNQIERLLGGP